MIETYDLFDQRDFLRLAYRAADRFSHDPDTKNGAILVNRDGTHIQVAAGVNRLPDGVLWNEKRCTREGGKYQYLEHAERDAIFTAQRMGIKTEGAILFVPWYACDSCARAIIAAGIYMVVGHKQMFDKTPERWKASIEAGDKMLDEAGVIRHVLDGPVGGCKALFDGEVWEP